MGRNQPKVIDIGVVFPHGSKSHANSVPFTWALRTQPGRVGFYEVCFMAHAHTQMCNAGYHSTTVKLQSKTHGFSGMAFQISLIKRLYGNVPIPSRCLLLPI